MDKAAKGMIGIYSIKNLKTNELYIGSSGSIHNRIKAHMSQLANGVHINVRLQESWKRDGAENFQFSILEISNDKYTLSEREIFWIEKTGALSVGFNTKTDQYKQRTLISIHMQTKKNLEELNLGSMNKTIQKLLEFFLENRR